MDESKLQEIEDRANETVLRCVRCDAPARWRDHSVAGIPGGGEDWVCNDHVANRREAHDIATVELDALDLVAEVRCLRAQLAVHQSATDAAVDGVRAMLPAALATARREGAEAVRDAVMGYLDEIFPGGPAATDARWPHELMEHVACAVAQAMREGGE